MSPAMNRFSAFARRYSRRFDRLWRDLNGVSAVEFALLLPLMVTLYLGTVEVSQGISVDRKVTMTARTIADLVSQSTTINNSAMTDILNASSAVIYPYATGPLKVTVTSVNIDARAASAAAVMPLFLVAVFPKPSPASQAMCRSPLNRWYQNATSAATSTSRSGTLAK